MSETNTTYRLDYQLLDSGHGRKLEKIGGVILDRPQPNCLWGPKYGLELWSQADAIFQEKRFPGDKSEWLIKNQIPEKWAVLYQDLTLNCKLSPFGHIGLFPEQQAHWQWLNKTLITAQKSADHELQVLNLFGYTGISSLVCAQAGAKVTHVDASYPAIGWARENQQSSGLTERPIRWLKEDALKYVGRELNRGNKYDGIIMDPPKFGHGPHKEKWILNKSMPQLLGICEQILVEKPLFILINAYAFSSIGQLKIMLRQFFPSLNRLGKWDFGQLWLSEESGRHKIDMGLYAKWEQS